MSTYPGSVDQDDVLGQGSVESSAFGHGGEPHQDDDLHAGVGSEKRKRNPLWLWVIGGLGAAAVITVGAMLFLGRRGAANNDASFAQVAPAAPQPQMDAPAPAGAAVAASASAAAAETPPSADPVNGSDVTIGAQASPATAPVAAPTAPVVDAPVPAAEASVESATPAKPAPDKPAPVVAAVPAPAAQKSDAARLQELEERYEALSGDYARLSDKFQRASAAAEKRRAEARSATRSTPAPAPVVAKVAGVQLKAVVDNSAWVQTESGDSVMVTPGDEIPGVGQVRSVDPETGTVRLADGRVIR